MIPLVWCPTGGVTVVTLAFMLVMFYSALLVVAALALAWWAGRGVVGLFRGRS